MSYPRVNIDCYKIYRNVQYLMSQLNDKNITITPVTKAISGHPIIARVLIEAGAMMFADSRISNIKRMVNAGITNKKMLIRTPMLSQVASVVRYCDISLNTEVQVLKKLSQIAKQFNLKHGVIIMVELGDLREGVMPNQLMDFIRNIIYLPNLSIKGIGTNLTCRYGINYDGEKMALLSELAEEIEDKFRINLDIISGGNSAAINWALTNKEPTRINNLRIGEAVYLGCLPKDQRQIKELYTDAITLTAEVIESKAKPSLPWGKRSFNAFGEKEFIQDKGIVSQAILAIGRQDVCISGLSAPSGMKIISSSSDHLVIEALEPLCIGDKVMFQLNYSALLSSMSSSSIYKNFNS